jgi:heme/copper-type cytochrome/quinol oxidase subunit 2
MAEIHVEPKKQASNTMWIWVVVVLVIAALAYFLVTRNRAADNTATPANTAGVIVLPMPLFSNAVPQ